MSSTIKIIGLGRAGGNVINCLAWNNIQGTELIAADTDSQDLSRSLAKTRILLGGDTTLGQGTGGDAAKGRRAAIESKDEIKETLSGSDMVIITAGMGGGTGTAAASIVASLARELGILTIGVIAEPPGFENLEHRQISADELSELRKNAATLIFVPCRRIFNTDCQGTPQEAIFLKADDAVRKAIQIISDVITTRGVLNMDFEDVQDAFKNGGDALIGMGEGKGFNRASKAAQAAINSLFLGNYAINSAKKLSLNISVEQHSFHLLEIHEALEIIRAAVNEQTKIKVGVSYQPRNGPIMRIAVIATGLNVGLAGLVG